MGKVHETNDDRMHLIGGGPTPLRQPDPRLSNLVLEGGRQKAYPPPPPPPPMDRDCFVDVGGVRDRIDFYLLLAALWAAIVIGLWLIVRGCH